MEKNSSMKYEVRAIGVWAFIKLAFFLNLVVGFIAGLIYAAILIPMISLIPLMNVPGMDPSEFAPGLFLIVLPLTFSFLGGPLLTIFETIVIILYNLFSRFLGGLELTLKPVSNIDIRSESVNSAPALTPSIRPLPPVSPTPQPPQVNQILNESIKSFPAPSDSQATDKLDNDAGHKDDSTPQPPPPPQQV